MFDGWVAQTSDGRSWSESDETLQSRERSPWRELQACCVTAGLSIVSAEIHLGERMARVEAAGCELVAGQLLTTEIGLAGEGTVARRYRWIMRQETTRRLWTIIGEEGTWQYETPPAGPLECPQPLAADML